MGRVGKSLGEYKERKRIQPVAIFEDGTSDLIPGVEAEFSTFGRLWRKICGYGSVAEESKPSAVS
jgi:hypothetical protein